ncbi:MAG: AAA family ATPase, partial [Ardenticatenales bacterium]|nr:AAA family ATPase [Ardenticatenales bacterium]
MEQFVNCSACKEPLVESARFCHHCGEPVDRHRSMNTSAERRQVTVLFADLAGFTAFSAKHDPEEVATLIEASMDALTQIIDRYGGVVDKYLGDGVMALFGAPTAHEDDPQRALYAALDMPDALYQACERVGLPEPFELHIGVSTGLVIAGNFGGRGYRTYTVIGDTANLASRLSDQAQTGEALISPSTWLLAQDDFIFEALPAVYLKGIAEEIIPYRLKGRSEQLESDAAPRRLQQAPLIGRDEQLEILQEAMRNVVTGQGGCMAVVSEAGLGKSRLVDEVRRSMPGDLHWLRAQAVSYRQGVPGSFFRQILGAWMGMGDEDDERTLSDRLLLQARRGNARDLLGVVTMLSLLALPVPPEQAAMLTGMGIETVRQQGLLAARQWLARRVAIVPTVLVLDDFQWIDELSQEILTTMLALTESEQLLVIILSRPPLAEWAAASLSAPVIEVKPLESGSIVGMVQHLLGGPLLSPALLKTMVERAEGNPFFVEEMTSSLVEQGLLVKTESGWRSSNDDPIALTIPTTLQGLLQARIDNLPLAGRQLLQLASMLGRSFSRPLMRAVAEREGVWQEKALEGLLEGGLLQVKGENILFAHNLSQETAYRSMLLRDRRERHRLIGELIETQIEEPLDDRLPRLAGHFAGSDAQDKGLRYTLLAAERAIRLLANEEAVRLYQQALRLWDAVQPEEPLRGQIEERLGDALAAVGRLNQAIEVWKRIPLGDYDAAFASRILRKLGEGYTASGQHDEAKKTFGDGLTRLIGNATVEEAWLWSGLARLLFRLGDNKAAITGAARTLVLARRYDIPEVMAHTYNTIGCAYARSGQLQKGISALERSLKLAQSHILHAVACRAYTNLGMLVSQVDPDRARVICEEGLE